MSQKSTEERSRGKIANRPDPVGHECDESVIVRTQPSAAHSQARLRVKKKLSILLVDDDFTSRVMLQGLLLPLGECHVAVNGIEAVEAFGWAFKTAKKYDLICMDVRMPEMDGIEAVRQIRSIEEAEGVLSTFGVKILMTTAMCDLKTVNSSYGSLCDAYLLKPIDGAQLERSLVDLRLVKARAHRRPSQNR